MRQFEVGNYIITFPTSDGKGYVANSKKKIFFDFFIGYDFHLYLYNADGTQIPCPHLPTYIRKKIVSNERQYRSLRTFKHNW